LGIASIAVVLGLLGDGSVMTSSSGTVVHMPAVGMTGMPGPVSTDCGPPPMSPEEELRTLELINSHLQDNRINGISFTNNMDGLVMINPNMIDTPHVLATISVHPGPTVRIYSKMISTNVSLAEPDSLDQVIVQLGFVADEYNKLAKLMKAFGSELLEDNCGITFHMAEFKLKRDKVV